MLFLMFKNFKISRYNVATAPGICSFCKFIVGHCGYKSFIESWDKIGLEKVDLGVYSALALGVQSVRTYLLTNIAAPCTAVFSARIDFGYIKLTFLLRERRETFAYLSHRTGKLTFAAF